MLPSLGTTNYSAFCVKNCKTFKKGEKSKTYKCLEVLAILVTYKSRGEGVGYLHCSSMVHKHIFLSLQVIVKAVYAVTQGFHLILHFLKDRVFTVEGAKQGALAYYLTL